ncbi:MAG: cytochrome c [Pseudomonadota bacterium]
MKMTHKVHSFLVMMMLMGPVMADTGHEKTGGDDHMSAMPPGHWMAPAEAARRGNPIPADNVSRERGRKLFEANCASCHGLTGRGNGPIAARLETLPADLAAMAGQHPDGDFAWKISEGRGAMPAWKKILSEKQIWDIVNYLQKGLPRPGDDSHSHGSEGHRH